MGCKDELLSTPAAESEGSPGAWPHTGRSAARWSNRPTLCLGCVPEACGRGEQSAHPGAGGVRALIACSAAGASSPDLLRHFQGWDLVCPFLGGGCWAGPVWGCRGPQTSQLVPPRYQEQEPCGHVCRGHVCACVCSCVCVCVCVWCAGGLGKAKEVEAMFQHRPNPPPPQRGTVASSPGKGMGVSRP